MTAKFLGVKPRWIFLLAALVMTGCATRQTIDWSARVGNYNYDQAVLDFGPPEKSATLQDGTIVAEWLTQRGTRFYWTGPRNYAGYWGGPPVYSNVTESRYPDEFVRLTFGPDKRLREWKKVLQ